MREKIKGAHTDPATVDAQRTRRQQPGAQETGKDADALDPAGNLDQEKLRKNQERLDVGPDHKTPDMKKQPRGTFP